MIHLLNVLNCLAQKPNKRAVLSCSFMKNCSVVHFNKQCKQIIAVSLAALLVMLFVTATCATIPCAYANQAENVLDANTTQTQTATTATTKITASVTGSGCVMVPQTSLTNNLNVAITLTRVSAPEKFEWTNDAQGKTIEPGKTLTINWTAPNLNEEQTNIMENKKGAIGDMVYEYRYITQDSHVLPDKPDKKQYVFAVYSEADQSLSFYCRENPAPATGEVFEGKLATKVYNNITNMSWPQWFDKRQSIKKVNVVDKGIQPIQTAYWFSGFNKLELADLTLLDTSKTTTMAFMFNGCGAYPHKLTLNLSNFDTSHVTNMRYMFAESTLNHLDVSSFNTTNVRDMSYMFKDMNIAQVYQTYDLSKWDTSNVTKMNNMFEDCNMYYLNLKGWNVSKVTDMSYLFYHTSNTQLRLQGLNNWNVGKVQNMDYMFYNANFASPAPNLHTWNVSNVATHKLFNHLVGTGQRLTQPVWASP